VNWCILTRREKEGEEGPFDRVPPGEKKIIARRKRAGPERSWVGEEGGGEMIAV